MFRGIGSQHFGFSNKLAGMARLKAEYSVQQHARYLGYLSLLGTWLRLWLSLVRQRCQDLWETTVPRLHSGALKNIGYKLYIISYISLRTPCSFLSSLSPTAQRVLTHTVLSLSCLSPTSAHQ